MQIRMESPLWEWAKTRSWSGGRNRLQHLAPSEIDRIEEILEDIADSWDETQLNDFFWFDEETYLDWLGISQDDFNNRWSEEPLWK